jgi:hypothetical protein
MQIASSAETPGRWDAGVQPRRPRASSDGRLIALNRGGASADTSGMRRPILVAAIVSLAVVVAAPASAGAHACAQGDPAITASSRTSCALAVEILDRVYQGPVLRGTRAISVRSPVTRQRYAIRVVRRGNYVTATGRNGIRVRFFYCGC